MHPNPVYHTATQDANLDFARRRAFGVLSINGSSGPMVSHVPFLLGDDTAELHLVRSNPIARALREPVQAVLAVSGADSYVSPDWYGMADQVPTWNYIAVHIRGTLERRPDGELRALLDRQSASYEERLRPKTPWTADKMAPDALDKLLRQIVPCRMSVETVAGTWKLSQNKPDEVRLRAADEMERNGFGAKPEELAALMRGA